MTGTQIALLACMLAAGLLAGCPSGDSPANNYSVKSDSTGLSILANQTDPGIEFTKIAVGLPSRTLDFVGAAPLGLSGAKACNKIFFAADENGIAVIYSRDLATFERTKITTVKNMSQGSLNASSNGQFLVYCKSRYLDRYVDNPDINYPEVIALPYMYDVEKGVETELFDFRHKDWLPYRSAAADWSISPDGQRICFISYNIDRIMLDSQLQEWLYYAEAYNNPPEGFTSQDKADLEDVLRMLFSDSRLAPLLKNDDIDPYAKGAITEKEHAAVVQLQQVISEPEPVLLIYENGTPSLVPVHVQDGYSRHLHSIVSMGNNRIILGVQQSGADPTTPQEIFELDITTGNTSLAGTYAGVPSTVGIDAAEEFFMMVVNPMDPETKLLLPQTNLLKFPLDGGDQTTIELPGDFYGNIDVSTDGKHLVAQELGTNDLYIVDSEAGTKKLISQLVGPLDGVFSNDIGSIAGYLDSGIVGVIQIVDSPTEHASWVEPGYFSKYETLVRDFISDAGYVFPENATFEWEEREGLGAFEAACAVTVPGEISASFLTRYSVELESFVSVWYPTGNRLVRKTPLAGSELDFYDCQQIAEEMLVSVGWMDPATWMYYQPGSNPLYDGRSDSFVIIYRDGYFLSSGGEWVTNIEATLRVNAMTGTVEEMSLSVMDEVQNQTLDITPDRAAFLIRNQEDFAIPADAPYEINTTDFRLVIGSKTETAWGPAEHNANSIARLCYELDGYIKPEMELVTSTLVDVSTGEVLGQIEFMPTSVEGRVPAGAGG